jgi:hypothetical protein
MGHIYESILETVGRTPLVRTPNISRDLKADVVFKLESFNPMSSVKDRIGYSMINDAIERGVIKPGTTVIEPTSGNTGIGLAFICAAGGSRHPHDAGNMSTNGGRSFSPSARLVLTEGRVNEGGMAAAEEIQRQTPNSIIISSEREPGSSSNNSSRDLGRRKARWTSWWRASEPAARSPGGGAEGPQTRREGGRRSGPLPVITQRLAGRGCSPAPQDPGSARVHPDVLNPRSWLR